MSNTVEINSAGWTLTTFFGGQEVGRCYTLTYLDGVQRTCTEAELLEFFGQFPSPRTDYKESTPKRLPITWHVPRRAVGAYPYPIWPADWPVPKVGDVVYPAQTQPGLFVKAVCYYPSGEEYGSEPSIYVVLSETPPR